MCPHNAHVQYYQQRASPGGLLITEATYISPESVAYNGVPGIFTQEQVKAWQKVTAAVHQKGGKIVCQLWHTGRVAHPSFAAHPMLRKTGGPMPSVSASAVGMVHPKTKKPIVNDGYPTPQEAAVPRALEESEIPRLCRDYEAAARNALAAGFDGVEIHAAHGYLIDQFLQDGVNHRTDRYGGSIANRCRLLFEVVAAVVSVAGPGRVGVRISPTSLNRETGRPTIAYYATTDSDPDPLYEAAVGGLNNHPLAYLLLSEPRWTGKNDGNPRNDPGHSQARHNDKFRRIFRGTLIGAGGFTPAGAREAVSEGIYDMVAFGRWFIANPDLPQRIQSGAVFNVYDRSTFYGGDEGGYTDYPDLRQSFGEAGKYGLMEQTKIGASLAGGKKGVKARL